MKTKELFTREVYEAAQAYRHAPSVYQDEVARKYREMVLLIARTARKVDDRTPKEESLRRRRVVEDVFIYYCERIGKSHLYTLTGNRLKKGMARLANCLKKTKGDIVKAEELMRICIDTMAASKFHMGENESHKTYNDWENQLFCSEDKLEKWLEEAQR